MFCCKICHGNTSIQFFDRLGMGAYPCGPWEIDPIARAWHWNPKLSSWSRGMQVESTPLTGWKPVARVAVIKRRANKMRADQFVWKSYSNRILGEYPLIYKRANCDELSHVINFEGVEWHRPDASDSLVCIRVCLICATQSLTLQGFDRRGHVATID